MIKSALKYIFLIGITFAICELICRLAGIQPSKENQITSEYMEAYRDYMCNNKTIGILPCPNDSRTLLLANQVPYRVSHLADGSRFCGYKKTNKPNKLLLLTGDSNIHGDGVNDSSHVGFLLQDTLSDYKIINRAIPGSGIVGQIQVLKESLEHYKPDMAIAAYGSYQNFRNVFGREMRKMFIIPKMKKNYYRFPRGVIQHDSLTIQLVSYYDSQFPFSDKFALSVLIDNVLGKIEYQQREGDKVTIEAWKEYIKTCRENQIALLVAVISSGDNDTENFKSFLERENVHYVSMELAENMTYKPIDPHPNPKGHLHMRDKLLKGMMLLSTN